MLPMDETLERRWNEVCERFGKSGYSALSPQEQLWLNVRSLIDSIESGGLVSYFYNSSADTLSDCLSALDELGQGEVKKHVQRVCALFPGGVPKDIGGRNAVINSWDDSDIEVDKLLDGIDETLMPMMAELEAKLTSYLQRCGLAT